MELDFKNSNTTYSTHGFHTYPAKMIPQIAKALLDEFSQKGHKLFDPYCGSGTSLVEGSLHGLSSIGTDLNPLARLIARVKTTPIELQTLDLHLNDFYNYLFKYRFGIHSHKESVIIPSFHNIDFWFSKKIKNDLAVIHHYIELIENVEIKDFFRVAFSQTIRECSWSRKNEFKLYRMSKERIKVFKPDTFSTFEKILGKNRNGLKSFMDEVPDEICSSIGDFNSSSYIPKRIIPSDSIDIVLTSPPYGDSTTTVAYGQFSAHANQWLGFLEKGRLLDKQLMGGKKRKNILKFHSDILNDQIKEIEIIDRSRALDVVSFYKDYYSSIKNVSTTIKSKGYACYVVSNRTVRGIRLQTHEITKDFFEHNGFSHIETHDRIISNKRMPKMNSSVGKQGNKTDLMNKEYVVIVQKK